MNKVIKKERESNIELLRLLAMFLVLIVHADFFSLEIPTPKDTITTPTNAFIRLFFESSSIVCVNVFVLISGWFGIKPNTKSFCNFVFQCLFFLIGIYIILLICGLTKRVSRMFLHVEMELVYKSIYRFIYIISSLECFHKKRRKEVL